MILICGCGKTGGHDSGDFLRRASESGSESTEEDTMESTSEQDGNNPASNNTESDRDTLQSKWSIYKNTESGTESNLLIGYDPKGQLAVYLNTICYEGESLCFQLCNVCLNGNIRVPDCYVLYYGSLEKSMGTNVDHVIYTSLNDFQQVMMEVEDGKIQSIEFDYFISMIGSNSKSYDPPDDLTEVYHERIRLQFPEEYSYGILLDSFLGARAEGQMIFDDDRKSIRLVEFGGFPGIIGTDPYLYLEFSNRTDKTVSFQLAGLIVNGMFIEKRQSISLKAGLTEFVDLNLSESEFEGKEVDRISELSLLFLTVDNSQENDNVYSNNVVICPIQLSEKCNASGEREDGIELYHENGIRIGLKKRNQEDSYLVDGIRYEWTLAITNETDKYVRIQSDEEKIDGVDSEDSLYGFSLYGYVAPNTTTYLTCSEYRNMSESEPRISFHLVAVDAGNDRLLFRTDQPIEIEPE